MEEVVIQNTFKVFGSKSKLAELTMDGESIVIIADRKKKPKVIKVDMLIRTTVETQKQDNQQQQQQQVLEIYYVSRPDAESGNNPNSWRLGSLRLCHRDTKVLTSWEAVLNRKMKDSARVRPKRLLVFVNPHGGRGRAQQVYRDQAEPVFAAAGIECTVVVTQSADHAERYIGQYDGELGDRYDGVVSVGGDGMFNQVCDAVVRRANGGSMETETARDLSAPKLRLGVIPAGSTDAVAYTLHGTARADAAALHVALGDARMVDALAVSVDGAVKCLSLTIASRGFFGDNLAWSERLRFLGPSRYEAAGVVNFMANRSFQGTVFRILTEVIARLFSAFLLSLVVQS